ncbi:MAG: DNA-binding domain-containing protein [Lysobacter sp.]|nr:DNA-binding domain-containing protein [Lysobacter sp.]
MRTLSAAPLAQFQDAFSRALFEEPAQAGAAVAALVAQPAFAVYRNTVAKGCIDALQANFPAVARLVGEDWFRAAAAVYVADERPAVPSLLAYGESFPQFLRAFPPAAELPYLAGVAQLDRFWTAAHVAADASALEHSAFARFDPDMLGEAMLHPHPAARWAWFDEGPVFTIWSRNREECADEGDIDWRAEGALITRPEEAVRWTSVDAAGCRFLDACAQGQPIAQALDAALGVDPDANLVRLVSGLLAAGAFAQLTLPSRNEP